MADRKEILASLTPNQTKFMEIAGRMSIDDLVNDALKASEAVEAAETNAVLLKEVLMRKVYDLGETKYKNTLATVAIQTRRSPDRLDRTMLIAKGVDPDILDACTIPGTESEPFVTVRAAKVKVS